MPACWASPDKSNGNGSSPVNVQEVYEAVDATCKNGEKSTNSWPAKPVALGETQDDNTHVEERPVQVNPEELLELANNDSGVDLARENELSPAQEESAEVRSFTFTKLHFDPKLSQEKRREHILNWQKK